MRNPLNNQISRRAIAPHFVVQSPPTHRATRLSRRRAIAPHTLLSFIGAGSVAVNSGDNQERKMKRKTKSKREAKQQTLSSDQQLPPDQLTVQAVNRIILAGIVRRLPFFESNSSTRRSRGEGTS